RGGVLHRPPRSSLLSCVAGARRPGGVRRARRAGRVPATTAWRQSRHVSTRSLMRADHDHAPFDAVEQEATAEDAETAEFLLNKDLCDLCGLRGCFPVSSWRTDTDP